MNEQVNIRISQKLLKDSKEFANQFGFGSLQELIKEALREKVYERLSIEYLQKRTQEFEKSKKYTRKDLGI